MLDLGAVKKDFSALLAQVQPWTLSHFVMWLDIKVAEYKVFGRMIMADNTPNDTPQWLRASADYLEQQHKEAQAQAVAQAVAQAEKDISPPAPPPPPPPLSPRSAHTAASLRPAQPVNSTYEPVTSFATTASSLYTVTTVNTTVASPSVSPGYTGVAQIRPTAPVETFQKQQVPISSPEVYAKPSALAQFQGYHGGSQRIPPISHLSPKHIRQSHLEHSLSSMAVPVSLAPASLSKDQVPPHSNKESLTTAEVESQIAVLESQIEAVNRSLKQSEALNTAVAATPSKSGRRKAESSAEDVNGTFVPPPYPKKTRHQSPVSASRASVESTLPPLHTSMDMLARMHRIDTDSIPESLRSQNIQSTLEAFEALRTQTFPGNSEVLRTQIQNEVESIQSTAQDMSLHHVTSEREQLAAYTAPVDREQVYPVAIVEREQTYTPTSVDREAATAAFNVQQAENVQVKVEQSHSDEDSMCAAEVAALRSVEAEAEMAGSAQQAGPATVGTPTMEDGQTYPVSMYPAASNTNATPDEKLAAEITTKKMRRKFLESMKNSNPKYYSHQIQQIIPFPERFPVSNLDYGLKALQMIQTGEITRAGKIQLIDTIFHELIKYTGLYPTPTQKMAVANAIVETFPTLAAKMKASHISPADSWYVILCDKFRNERRGLSGSGATPRVGKGRGGKDAEQGGMAMPQDPTAAGLEATEEATVEVSTTEEEIPADDTSHHTMTPPAPVGQTTPTPQQQQQYVTAEQATAQAQAQAQAHAAFHQAAAQAAAAYPTVSQASVPKDVTVVPVPDMTSEEDEIEEVITEQEKQLMLNNEEQRRLYTATQAAAAVTTPPTAAPPGTVAPGTTSAVPDSKGKRSVRRKTHSPKRVQKMEMPILDERYAASLLEYYSKHKPYYPAEGGGGGGGGDMVVGKSMEAENLKGDSSLVIDDKGVNTSASVNQAIAQAVASHAVGNTDEPYSAEVAAIVQSVVSAHMDEVLAARNYQVVSPGVSEAHYLLQQQPPTEVDGTVEVKTTKKSKPKIQQKEKTPEQMQVNLQRFKQKLAVTYPGVQAIDDATLLCTCGTKVKLGRARMLHNYTNYHMKRCQNPPANIRHESHSPSSATPGSVHSMYAGSPGELNIPTTGPRVITREVESAAYAGLSAADKESIQKHFLLNIPVPTSESLSAVGPASTPPNQSLDLTMPVSESPTQTLAMSVSEANNLTVTSVAAGVDGAGDIAVEGSVECVSSVPVVTVPHSDAAMLAMSMASQAALINSVVLASEAAAADTRSSSVTVTAESDMTSAAAQSLDLSVQTSGPSVLIEHQPGSDLRMQIPGSIATSIAEYSGELPDLSAINALALIQGKSDHAMETIESEPANTEEPINLADS